MKRILVPTDFSFHAQYAADLAIQIAKRNSGRVSLCHIAAFPPGWGDMSNDQRQNHPEASNAAVRLDKQLAALQSAYAASDVPVDTKLIYGNVGPGFRKLMEETDADLIVIGSHGTSGIQPFSMGSNAQKVVRYSQCPVIVLKEPTDLIEFKHLVFASNFNLEAKKAFKVVVDFARLLKAEIHLLTINAPAFFNPPRVITHSSMDAFKQLAEEVPCFVHDIQDVSVEEGIIHFADRIQADMIAIGTYGRKAMSRIFIASIAEALVNHIEIPVMTINIHD